MCDENKGENKKWWLKQSFWLKEEVYKAGSEQQCQRIQRLSRYGYKGTNSWATSK